MTDKKEIDEELAFAIVDTRILKRPKVNMRHVWVCLFGLIFGHIIIGTIWILIPLQSWECLIYFLISFFFFNEFYLRFFGIILIKAYQHYASDEMRNTCHCVPSCSEYSITVLKKYPLIIAFLKIIKRLNKTCDGTYKIDKP